MDDNKYKEISDRIKDGLKWSGLSKLEFSKLMDVQPSIITRWLSGKHNFTLKTICKIESKLRIKIISIDRP